MLGTVKKVLAVTAIGLSLAYTAGGANAADTVDIRSYIDLQGGAKDGSGGEKAVSTFDVGGGLLVTAGAGSRLLPDGGFVDQSGNGWSAYHDYGNAGMGVTEEFDAVTKQATNVADDNVQVSEDVNGHGQVLTFKLDIGQNYRIDELYFRDTNPHDANFVSGANLDISTTGAANSWTEYAMVSGIADNSVIGATLVGFPAGGIIMSAASVLYLAYNVDHQFYLSGFTFTLLNNQLEPVPLPAGILLLLSGLLGLGFLGRSRAKRA